MSSHETGRCGGLREQPDTARELLEHWVRSPTAPQRLVRRSRILLLTLDGAPAADVASALGVSRRTVALWTKRFGEGGPEALLHDAPGRGRHPSVTAAAMRDTLRAANLLGPDDRPVSLRRAAAVLGISATSVWRALHQRESRRPSLGVRSGSRRRQD